LFHRLLTPQRKPLPPQSRPGSGQAGRAWLAAALLGLLALACSREPQPWPTYTPIISPVTLPALIPTGVSTLQASPTPPPANTPAPSSAPEPSATPADTLLPEASPTPEPSPAPEYPYTSFAVIGDYGSADQNAENVANLIHSWNVDFIITTGDNNYPLGEYETIDDAIGENYHSYIYPYQGHHGEGSSYNRFFPCLGNHDLYTDNGQPYFDYFQLPGNERYYEFTWGPLHFFALNNNTGEPDGIGASSIQAAWLQERLAASTLPWKIVYMHVAPLSSGSTYGSTDWAQWPYAEWGASAVLAGHEHVYERLDFNGIPYFVNGLGGGTRYAFGDTLPWSMERYYAQHGAMLVEATGEYISFQFIAWYGEVIDTYVMYK